ncbi:MAG: helix-turn-helix domain-containing protein [Gammaproteobacteria bacterium]|nr:helix-turn-helix domain-containing protein [Gammaproteobacteria bacterium]
MARKSKAVEKTETGSEITNDVLASIPPQYKLQEEQPYAREFGVRIESTAPESHGHRDYCVVREGLAVLIGDIEHDQAHSDANVGQDQIKFHFRYSGSSEVGEEGGERDAIDPMTFGVLIQPSGLKKVEYFSAAQHEQSVTLLCEPDFLEDIISGASLALPSQIKKFLYGKSQDMYHCAVRMRPEMSQAVKTLFEMKYTGKLRQLQIEAKVLDLLCHTLDQLSDMWGGDEEDGLSLRRRDLERVADICDILDKNLVDAPTIPELARTLSWNETQLMRTFRQAVGITVHNYLHRARMERAYELLSTSELSITQVALEVGYEYASNFTTAFGRYFKLTPKQVRGQNSGSVQ